MAEPSIVHRQGEMLPVLCCGRACFMGMHLYPQTVMVMLPCQVHFMCQRCLVEYIQISMSQSPYNPILCPGCLRGSTQRKEFPNAFITEILTKAEYEEFFEQHIRNRYTQGCQGYETCPLNGAKMRLSSFEKFPCNSVYCRDCLGYYYAICVEQEYNRLAGQNWDTTPTSYMFGCPSTHEPCKDYSWNERAYNMISESRLIDDQSKQRIVRNFEELNEFFAGKPVYVRRCNCGTLNQFTNDSASACRNCRNCVSCGQSSHPERTCREFQDLISQFPIGSVVQTPMIGDSSPEAQFFNKIAGSLSTACDFFIALNYIMLIDNKAISYEYQRLKTQYPNGTEKQVVLLEWMEESAAKSLIFRPLQPNYGHYIRVSKKKVHPGQTTCAVICDFYSTEPIQFEVPDQTLAQPESKCVVFEDQQYYYISNPKGVTFRAIGNFRTTSAG